MGSYKRKKKIKKAKTSLSHEHDGKISYLPQIRGPANKHHTIIKIIIIILIIILPSYKIYHSHCFRPYKTIVEQVVYIWHIMGENWRLGLRKKE